MYKFNYPVFSKKEISPQTQQHAKLADVKFHMKSNMLFHKYMKIIGKVFTLYVFQPIQIRV